jgi:hypothetical protein
MSPRCFRPAFDEILQMWFAAFVQLKASKVLIASGAGERHLLRSPAPFFFLRETGLYGI